MASAGNRSNEEILGDSKGDVGPAEAERILQRAKATAPSASAVEAWTTSPHPTSSTSDRRRNTSAKRMSR